MGGWVAGSNSSVVSSVEQEQQYAKHLPSTIISIGERSEPILFPLP